ncbi:MAG: site-specific DNA-methyltransferase [bacterium]|nr:site-specific DNA-methyltransferase [bacterium]
MDGQNLDIKKDILNKLKELIPNCFSEDKIDWERLKVFLEDNIEFQTERYHLNWAGKTDAFRLLQAPTYKTLKPCREESVNFDETENLFIEGDNLEVLKILQKSYFGKIKMIYIDPPYNTGNDFIYKDDYSETLAEYKRKVGDVDENGNATRAELFRNTKENGQYHSNWLNMMYPRLFLARNLLRDDGVIFVSIDDNEVHNLRLMMDEIFGEENFVACFSRKSGIAPRQDAKYLAVSQDYILLYSKNKNIVSLNRKKACIDRLKYKDKHFEQRGLFDLNQLDRGSIQYSESLDYPIIIETGETIEIFDDKQFIKTQAPERIEIWPGGDPLDKRWIFRWSKEKVEWGIENDFIVFRKINDRWKVFYKEYELVDNTNSPRERTNPYDTLILDFYNELGNSDIEELFDNRYFDYPKPKELIKHLLKIGSSPSDIILDFFAGSGTTAHAVMELNKEDGGNRKFILVQLPEPTAPDSEAFKAGYKTIADIAKERIRRAAKKIQGELDEEKKKKGEELPLEPTQQKKLDLGFKVFKLDESNFKQWRPFVPESEEEIKQAVLDFTENIKFEATVENILYELILKNGKKLTDKIEKKNGYYVVNNNELVLLLESVEKSVIDEVLLLKPQKVVALDKLFNGNDQLKTNTVLQFRDEGIEFKSV